MNEIINRRFGTEKQYIIESIRLEIFTKIGVRVTVYRQLLNACFALLSQLTIRRQLCYCFDSEIRCYFCKPDVYSLLRQILWLRIYGLNISVYILCTLSSGDFNTRLAEPSSVSIIKYTIGYLVQFNTFVRKIIQCLRNQ